MSASSLGKVILTGEHSVGCGEPAVVSAINLSLSIKLFPGTLDNTLPYSDFVKYIFAIFSKDQNLTVPPLSVEISGNLPIGSGLGSSAALGNALFQALANHFHIQLSQAKRLELVNASERYAHGEASGIDPTAVVEGGLLRFQRKQQQLSVIPLSAIVFARKKFFLIQSGKPTESTKDMVLQVRRALGRRPKIKQLMKTLGELAEKFVMQIKTQAFEPEILTENERYLEMVGIVGQKAKSMIAKIEKTGGFAKITGAGGTQAGSGIVLAYHDDPIQLTDFLERQQWEYYPITLGARTV